MIPNKTFNGLQLRRVYNNLVEVGDGSCAAGATKPMDSNRPMEPAVLITVPGGKSLSVDINLPAVDDEGKWIDHSPTLLAGQDLKRSRTTLNLGGVLNGREEDGGLESGFYYGFVGTTKWPADGVIDPEDAYFYISRYFISGGVGSDDTRGGAGENKQPLKYVRPLPAALMIQKDRHGNDFIVPFLQKGEGHTAECRYQNTEWRGYKAARIGGVLFAEDGEKSYDHSLAVVPTEPQHGTPRLSLYQEADADELHRQTVGARLALEEAGLTDLYNPEDIKDIHYSLFDVIPQTHKSCEMQIEFEGEGLIYSSVSKNIGSLIACANGGRGVARWSSNSGSDAAGRGFSISILGDVKITRCYLLASTSQQPM